MHRSLRGLLLAGAATFAATDAQAQNLVTLEGVFPSAGEFTMHGPDACGFPNPDHFVWPLFDPLATCGTINSFTPPPVGTLGDAAIDRVNDVIWATDGLQITGYQLGVAVSTLTLAPGTLLNNPITGLGYDSENQRMWLTDGFDAIAIAPPSPGCSALPAVVVAPFAMPPQVTLATDIDWDSWADTLWVCDTAGMVTNLTTAGAIGPKGSFSATLCSLTANLTGVAFDTARGTLLVSDGAQIVHYTTNGAGAPPSFYAPNSPCTTPPPPGPPSLLAGLGFSPRPLPFGAACATVGTPPAIGWTGNFSTTPNPAFGITLTGAMPSSTAVLLLGLNATCTGPSFGACPVLAFPFVLTFVTSTTGAGDAAVPLPIPALPLGSPLIGLNVKAQWLVQPSVLGKQTSDGLSFTISTL